MSKLPFLAMVLCVGSAMVFAPMTAMAQPVETKKPVRTKFVNMEEMLLKGGIRDKAMVKVGIGSRSDFRRLVRLKKSFLPKVQRSARSSSL